MLVEQSALGGIDMNSDTANVIDIRPSGWRSKFSNGKAQIYLDQSNRIAVKFHYNEEYIQKLKVIPGHKWHPDDKRWSFPLSLENYECIIKIFEGEKLNIDTKLNALINPSEKKSDGKVTHLDEAVNNDIRELRRQMRLQNYSNKTIKAYLSYIRTFAKSFHPRNLRQLSEGDIREYLIRLSESGNYAASTINQIFNALRFLYVNFYKMSYAIGSIPRPRKERKLPDILNEDELNKLFAVIKNPKHRLLIRLIYSGGFRVSESVQLRLEDVDTERGLIHIRGGKGKKDRTTILSKVISEELKEYVKLYYPQGFIFEGQKQGRYLSIRSAEKIFERAVKAARIGKHVSLHTLRHTFATDLVDDNTELRTIQEILGHASSKTTERYTQVSKKRIGQVRSPLDRLSKKNDKENEES
ncbi:MAG: tyrosine-type recombinase/integrase [Bacteroidota bacterium]|nr:tyrosine-type recombinase/integrase [Bacteroidota bacterium]